MPRAPTISVSISGSGARARRPRGAVLAGREADAHQRGAGVPHDRADVGEVEVDQAGQVIRSLMPWTPWRSTSSATRNASSIEVDLSSTSSRRSFGIDDHGVAGLAQLLDAVVGLACAGACPRT